MLGLAAKQIVLHTGKPFIYFLLWIMNSHHNNVSCLAKHSTNLLSTTVKIFQSTNDKILSKKIRIATATENFANTDIHYGEEGHQISSELDQYLIR